MGVDPRRSRTVGKRLVETCIVEEFEIVGVGVVPKYEHSDTVAFHRCALFVFVFVYV